MRTDSGSIFIASIAAGEQLLDGLIVDAAV